ncbi:glycosyl hydrolase [Tanacetum coccineum]|uniref:Glycosyl hydrolase n=1 Tax=Tanacetum coccineum TaxID=301880 RepID=A0ABQ5HF16_9ASTR
MTQKGYPFLEELLSNDSFSLPENESFHFYVPSSPRPPAKPPDDDEIKKPDTEVLTAKVVGDISELDVHVPNMLDVDRLVYSFRETASLPNFEVAYGGWEAPDQELRGHFVGHYLSALAQMWASTSNDTLKKKMTAVVSALVECQEKIGTVYLSAFTSKIFNCFEAIKPVWAPYYTIHKIMAGLVDKVEFCKSEMKVVTTIPRLANRQRRHRRNQSNQIFQKELIWENPYVTPLF